MLSVQGVVTKDAEARLMLCKDNTKHETIELKDDEILIRVEAAPVNPSDLGRMLAAGTDAKALSTLKEKDFGEEGAGLSYQIDKKHLNILKSRVGKTVRLGNEGAGVVVRTGKGAAAKKLQGKVVSAAVGMMYSQYVKVKISQVLVHSDGVTPEEAASSYINPLTVVCMVETLRKEGHKAMIHTAAASQLGQMLVKMCLKENVPLINVVRKEAQEKTLKDLGAKYIVRSDKDSFLTDLSNLCGELKATCAFDAIGGGDMATQLLKAMENGAKTYAKFDPTNFYGTAVQKTVYVYGGLDPRPMTVGKGFGFCWSITAFLMPNVMATFDLKKVMAINKTVSDNIKTIFKTEYYKRVSLKELLTVKCFAEYSLSSTGKKFLVMPNKDVRGNWCGTVP